MRWWTSDLHGSHFNVIRYCNRPFVDIHHMNETLIRNWNESVGTSDDVWFLGDMVMNHSCLYLINRLNFGHLYWILGNHDKESRIIRELDGGSLGALKDKVSLAKSAVCTIKGTEFFVVHRPMDSSDFMPSLVGHVHERWTFLPEGALIKEHSRRTNSLTEKTLKQPILNVGVDVHGYKPISDEQVLTFFREKQ